MKKNLLNKEDAEALIRRVQNLQAGTEPRWGRMTATEMLLHCNKVHAYLLSPAATERKRTTPLQYLVRWTVLYLLPAYPRNAKAPKQMETKGSIDAAAFEEQKQAYMDLLRRFCQHASPIEHHHPYFGNLGTRQWGFSSWKHADHHLRQFGV